MGSSLFADGIQVTFTAHRGFGCTGHRLDKKDGSPGYCDHADEGTMHTLCLYFHELLAAGALYPELTSDAGRRIRVRPAAAHFLPPDPKLIKMAKERLSKLLTWLGSHYPGLPLVLIAESAGTHMAIAILKALQQFQWAQHRIVLAGFCIPPCFLRDIVLQADKRVTLVVHAEDKTCPVAPLKQNCWRF